MAFINDYQFNLNVFPFSSINLSLLLGSVVIPWIIYLIFLRPMLSPLSRLPGPKNESLIFGNSAVPLGPEAGYGIRKWHDQFGPTIRVRGFFGTTRLCTVDPKALHHILVSKAYSYPKPQENRRTLGNMIGRGLLFAEGQAHKRQKRMLGPTFYPSHIKQLVPIVYETAYLTGSYNSGLWLGLLQLRQKWTDLISASEKPYLVIDVMSWFSRSTLDIIGSAGFGYQFGALESDEETSKLGKAFQRLNATGANQRTPFTTLISQMIQLLPAPLMIYKPALMKVIDASLITMRSECKALLDVKKKEAAVKGAAGKDLVSVLLRANRTIDEKERLSDEEVIGQMTTFLFAGHETAATTLAWLFWTLAKNPSVQEKLRQELQEAGTWNNDEEDISFDRLNSLPFLEAVCREILRIHPPASQAVREAAVSDVIPVSGDAEPIQIAAGEKVMISIPACNLSQAAFGPDADLFRPERWLQDAPASRLPGVWAGLMSFLGGPRACIGYRFAIMEIKVLVSVIIPQFRFEERDGQGNGPEIDRVPVPVMRPIVRGDSTGPSMPLRVSLV
ncbi:cytochrome P450 monooxygenase [Melampsora americana]|nr:cytochrome P450 monooxygenase [Melampsora americana]